MEEYHNEKMTRTTFWCLAVIVGLFLMLVFSFLRFLTVNNELQELRGSAVRVETNEKVLAFTHLLIDKVLKNNSAVSFEDRLELENSVRETEDAEILAAWKAFVESGTEQEAQANIVELLGILIEKVQ